MTTCVIEKMCAWKSKFEEEHIIHSIVIVFQKKITTT